MGLGHFKEVFIGAFSAPLGGRDALPAYLVISS